MICPHCHMPNMENAIFCSKCGKSISTPPQALGGPITSSSGDTICPHCHTANKTHSQFCKKCGSALPAVGTLIKTEFSQHPPAFNQVQSQPSRRIGPDEDLPLWHAKSPGKKLIESIGIAHPEQPHCPLVLLLDISGSMDKDNKIQQLNAGIQLFRQEIMRDELASRRVDVSIVTFGDNVSVVTPFTPVSQFNPPLLSANGLTPMGEAIEVSLDLIEQRKQQYKSQGVDYYRPWIFMITDGEPNDMAPGDATWNRVVTRVHQAEKENKVLFFSVGIDPANMDILRQITPPSRLPIRLIPGNFSEMFQWLSNSQEKVVRQDMGQNTGEVVLDPTTGWGRIISQ